MGYEVYITRKDAWFDDEGAAISLDEWLQYVERDPEMRADGFAEATAPDGSTLCIEDPGIAVWTAYSGHGKDGNMAWFMHQDDRVSVKNPDAEIRRKMFAIATALGASTQGEECERYGRDGEQLATAPQESSVAEAPKKPWWKFRA